MGEPQKICALCGGFGRVKFRGRGSLTLLLVLSCFFLVPGLIYLVWMMSGDTYACRRCKSQEVVDVSSRRGRQLVAHFHPSLPAEERGDQLPD